MSTTKAAYAALSKSLQDEIIKSSEPPSSERAIDILTLLQQEYNNNNNNDNKVTISILESTNICKMLTKTVTVCKRQKRPSRESSRSTRRSRRSSSSTNDNDDDDWDKALSTAEELLSKFKNNVKVDKKKKDEEEEETKQQKYVDDERMTNDDIDDDCADLSKNTTVTFSDNDNGSSVNEDTISSSDNNMNIATKNNNNNTYSEETLPKPLYNVSHRVYAKDDATGLLYPAFVRKVMWGPKSNQVNMGFCSSLVDGDAIGGILDDNEMMMQSQQSTAENEEEGCDDEEEEDEDTRRWGIKRNCYHYYCHYMGWAVKWDRWVEERYLKEASKSTELLSKVLMKEYNKVKPTKKGQKMTVSQMNKWMKKMNELEAEHKMMDKDGKLLGENENDGDIKMSEQEYTNGNEEETDETMNEHFKATVEVESEMKQEVAEESTATVEEQQLPKQMKQLNIEHLQKQAQLRGNGLQMKRKKSVSDQLTLPFNLKKILVEEWEVITQCNMVHNLPAKTSIREALDQYLESKLGPLRKKHEEEMNNDKDKTTDDGVDKMQIDDVPCNKSGKQTKLGKEWIDMVE